MPTDWLGLPGGLMIGGAAASLLTGSAGVFTAATLAGMRTARSLA